MITSHELTRWLALLGAVFIPFTSLRFGFAGIGEILLLSSLLLLLFTNKWRVQPFPESKPLIIFWVTFPFWLLAGFLYNAIFLSYSSGSLDSAVFDFASYLFILMIMVLLSDRNFYKKTTPLRFFRSVFFIWGLLFSIFFVLSKFVPSIFGLPLLYNHFFSPLVNNVHQAAMITSAMPLIMVFFALNLENKLLKIIYFVFGVLFSIMALQSGATKAWMALYAGPAVVFIALLLQNLTKDNSVFFSVFVYLLLSLTILSIVTLYWDNIFSLGLEFFQQEDIDAGREVIYSTSFWHAIKSPIVGYGPGSHAVYGGQFFDAHNTALTILLQGGVVAIVLFLVLIVRVALRAYGSIFLIGALCSVGIYTLGGDILRRAPIWIIVISIVLLAKKRNIRQIKRGSVELKNLV